MCLARFWFVVVCCFSIIDSGDCCVTPPGKGVAFEDTLQATFAAADATYAYTFAWNAAQKMPFGQPAGDPAPGWEWETNTLNSFRLAPSNESWLDKPMHLLPDPIRPEFGMPDQDADPPQNTTRAQYNPVEYVYRTIGLVRGDAMLQKQQPRVGSYVLLVDDAKKDNDEHLFEWLMHVDPDVKLTAFNGTDAILSDNQGRHLLIRVLELSSPRDVSSVTALKLEQFNGWTRENFGHDPLHILTDCGAIQQRLVISTKAVSPRIKLLLYPFATSGQHTSATDVVLPRTTFHHLDNVTHDKATLTVDYPGTKRAQDVYTLSTESDGRTRVAMQRGGADVLKIL